LLKINTELYVGIFDIYLSVTQYSMYFAV